MTTTIARTPVSFIFTFLRKLKSLIREELANPAKRTKTIRALGVLGLFIGFNFLIDQVAEYSYLPNPAFLMGDVQFEHRIQFRKVVNTLFYYFGHQFVHDAYQHASNSRNLKLNLYRQAQNFTSTDKFRDYVTNPEYVDPTGPYVNDPDNPFNTTEFPAAAAYSTIVKESIAPATRNESAFNVTQ